MSSERKVLQKNLILIEEGVESKELTINKKYFIIKSMALGVVIKKVECVKFINEKDSE